MTSAFYKVSDDQSDGCERDATFGGLTACFIVSLHNLLHDLCIQISLLLPVFTSIIMSVSTCQRGESCAYYMSRAALIQREAVGGGSGCSRPSHLRFRIVRHTCKPDGVISVIIVIFTERVFV
jgi:hypothetical protein